MKKQILTVGLIALAALPVMAVDNATVLTPGTLYEITQKQAKSIGELAVRIRTIQKYIQDGLNSSLTDHEDRIKALETKTKAVLTDEESKTAASDEYRFRTATVARLTELERKVGGMQKQITVLHSKNDEQAVKLSYVNGKVQAIEKRLQETRDSVATIAMKLRKEIRK